MITSKNQAAFTATTPLGVGVLYFYVYGLSVIPKWLIICRVAWA